MINKLIIVIILLAGLIIFCSKDYSSVDPSEIKGDYLFVEILIYSYAYQISGNCEQGAVGHTGIQYEYDSNAKTFFYRAGPPFPINEQLKMIFVQRQLFVPYSLAGGGDLTNVMPVYFIPDQLTRESYIEGVNSGEISLNIHLSYSFVSVDLPIDSTFHQVFKTVTKGVGDSCIWEYTDSLVITNYGLNPKSKIFYQPMMVSSF